MSTKMETRDGCVIGPWRTPTNKGDAKTTNIHNDGDAQKLGFRGGLVAGSIHMEMFLPVVIEALGENWMKTGNLSLYFMYATLHGEEVRAIVHQPETPGPNVQVETHGERPDGTIIGKGTAALGDPDAVSALQARDLSKFPAADRRILANINEGDEFPVVDALTSAEEHQARLDVITETMPWYTDPKRWDGLVATPTEMVHILQTPSSALMAERMEHPAVGLFGAIEIKNVNGPLLVDRPYRAGGAIRAIGESPKTEYYWFDSHADDEKGVRIAEMRMLLRFMKASSVLYEESAAT